MRISCNIIDLQKQTIQNEFNVITTERKLDGKLDGPVSSI